MTEPGIGQAGPASRYVFVFRASLCGPLWRETQVAVAVDDGPGSVAVLGDASGRARRVGARPVDRLDEGWTVTAAAVCSALDGPPERAAVPGVPGGDLARAYAAAETACRAALEPVLAEWEAEVERRRAAAEEELSRYYQRCLQEEVAGLRRVFHQVAVLRVRVSLARRAATRRQFRHELRRWEKELASQVGGKEDRAGLLAEELQRRRNELARRYAGSVEVTLVAAARLSKAAAAAAREDGQEKTGRPANHQKSQAQ